MKGQKAVLLVNVGTPDNPGKKAVRKYLFQFLNDKRVIDLPWLVRKFLVNVIIVPFRAAKSTQLYRRLWTSEGSPLLTYSIKLANKLNDSLGDNYRVIPAMRYGNPSLTQALKRLERENPAAIIIMPLFPQYASSTTGSIVEHVFTKMKKWEVLPELKIIDQFFQSPAFIRAYAAQIKKYNPEQYDHILFSYHGLPLRQINKVHPAVNEGNCSCEEDMPAHGVRCYKAACFSTTRLLTRELNLTKENFTTAFQSRLSKNWLTPFSDEIIVDLAKKGKKKLLVAAPSFVTDCLETIIEIGEDYNKIFQENGGEQLTLVSSLNNSGDWVKGLKEIISS